MAGRVDQRPAPLDADITFALPALDEIEPDLGRLLEGLSESAPAPSGRLGVDALALDTWGTSEWVDAAPVPLGGFPVLGRDPEPGPRPQPEPEPFPPPDPLPQPEPQPAPEPLSNPERSRTLDPTPEPRSGRPDDGPPSERATVTWLDRLAALSPARRRAVTLALAGGIAVAGAARMMAPVLASEPAVPDARPAVVVDPGVTSVARAVRPLIDVYAAADAPTPMLTLSHPTATGSPLVFVVDGSLGDWLRVRLPVSPPGRVGWVQAEHVDVTEHTMRIVVDLDERSLVVRDGDAVHLRVPIAVGPLDAPPRGTTFVAEVLALANSRTAYGTHVLTLAGHPASADQYFRGRGAVAIHGTDDLEGVRDGRTRGSIALSNAAVARLADSVPAGTPVDVRP